MTAEHVFFEHLQRRSAGVANLTNSMLRVSAAIHCAMLGCVRCRRSNMSLPGTDKLEAKQAYELSLSVIQLGYLRDEKSQWSSRCVCELSHALGT